MLRLYTSCFPCSLCLPCFPISPIPCSLILAKIGIALEGAAFISSDP